MAGPIDPVVGEDLPDLVKAPDREQLVKYAAGSGDFNPLHYDADFPQAQAIGGNIVHGRMKYAAMGELVSNWLGHRGWIRRISAQYRGMDKRGEPFTCRGRVVAVPDDDGPTGGARVVEIELWTENADGQTTTTGRAEVVLR